MSDIGQMVVRIIGDNAQFDTSITNSESKLNKFGNVASNIGNKLSLFVTAPVVGIGVAAVRSSAQMEMLEASFSTMLGSADKAALLMKDLQVMAAKTPFETTDLAQASKTLLQFGLNVDKLIPTLNMLGDAAGGSSARFSSMALVFGQITSLGRLQGQDLLQLINVGFNPLNEIAKITGETMTQLKDRMSKGGVSAQEVTQAFINATSAGGKFYKGMDTASKTLEGVMSTLKDDVMTLLRSLVTDLLPVIKDMVKDLSSLAQKFSDMSAEQKKAIVTVALFAASLGPLAKGIGVASKAVSGLSKAFTFLAANPVVAVIAGLAAISAMFIKIGLDNRKKQLDDIAEAFEGVAETAGLSAKEIDAVQNALIQGSKDPLIDVNEQVTRLSENLGIAKSAVIAIGLRSEDVSDAYKEQLEGLRLIVLEQERIAAAELVRARAELARASGQATAIAIAEAEARRLKEEEERKSEADKERAKADEKYKANRQIVLDILHSQLTEYQLIEEQIRLLESTPWAKGELEEDRLKAIEILRKKQKEIIDEEIQNEKNKVKELNRIQQEEEDKEQERLDEKKRKQYEFIKYVLDTTKTLANSIQGIADGLFTNQIDRIESVKDAQLKALNEQYEAELEAAGLHEQTELEKIQSDIDIINTKLAYETNAKKRAVLEEELLEAQKALKLEQIGSAYAEKALLIEEEAARKSFELELKQFRLNQAFNIAETVIDTASAAMDAAKDTPGGPIIKGIAAAAIATLGAGKLVVISGQQPPTLALAEGALVMPRAGGVQATIAEAGQPEAVIPLDKLNRFINNGYFNNNNNQEMMHLTVELDSYPILNKIFEATKSRQVLISSGAVV